jgi:hypothetical protein
MSGDAAARTGGGVRGSNLRFASGIGADDEPHLATS